MTEESLVIKHQVMKPTFFDCQTEQSCERNEMCAVLAGQVWSVFKIFLVFGRDGNLAKYSQYREICFQCLRGLIARAQE